MPRLFVLILTTVLAACGNTVATLHYTPTEPVHSASVATVSDVSATDQRSESPTRLATIMGTFGNPLKTLDTAKPVKDEIADAFREGLRTRRLLTSSGQASFQIRLAIRKFDADMIMGRTARIDLTMSVIDKAGRSMFSDQAIDSQSDMKFLETGVFANIADMQALSETVLNRTVDHMLDNPTFRAAIAHSGVST